jgi:hypothetical protein
MDTTRSGCGSLSQGSERLVQRTGSCEYLARVGRVAGHILLADAPRADGEAAPRLQLRALPQRDLHAPAADVYHRQPLRADAQRVVQRNGQVAERGFLLLGKYANLGVRGQPFA